MVVLHICGGRAILLLFYDHQDTESEWRETEIVVAGPILSQKNIKGSMVQLYLHPTRLENNIVAILHIYGTIAVFLLFYEN